MGYTVVVPCENVIPVRRNTLPAGRTTEMIPWALPVLGVSSFITVESVTVKLLGVPAMVVCPFRVIALVMLNKEVHDAPLAQAGRITVSPSWAELYAACTSLSEHVAALMLAALAAVGKAKSVMYNSRRFDFIFIVQQFYI
jgi:hypothetical protein